MHRWIKGPWRKVTLLLVLASSLVSCQATPGSSGTVSSHSTSSAQTAREQTCAAQFLPKVILTNALATTTHLLYVSDKSRIYALNAGNGTLRWCMQVAHSLADAEAGSFIHFFQLTLDNGRLYGDGDDSYTYAFDATTGALLWDYNTQALQTAMRPIVAKNVVYGGSLVLYALNAQNGQVLWQYPRPDSQLGTEGSTSLGQPLVDNGTVYITSSISNNGTETSSLQALDTATGTRRWMFPQQSDPHVQINNFSPLLAANGMVFFVLNGQVTAVNAQNGNQPLWQQGTNILQIVGEANGLLYAINGLNGSTSDTILALNIRDGSVRWSIPYQHASTLRFLATDTHLYAAKANTLYAWNAIDGSMSWQKQLESASPLMTTPALWNGEVYVGSLGNDNGMLLHALNAQTGNEDWYADVPQSDTLFGTYQAIAV